jgi:hypothetical protein
VPSVGDCLRADTFILDNFSHMGFPGLGREDKNRNVNLNLHKLRVASKNSIATIDLLGLSICATKKH